LDESSSLSSSPHPVVNVGDPSPNYNSQIQMEIWFKDKDWHNWFNLLILSVRAAQIWIDRGLWLRCFGRITYRLLVWCWKDM